jgi:hypothetical protein
VLLRPDQVAGTADLEVAHGDVETRAEFGEFFYRPQAHAALLSQRLALGHQQVGVGPFAGAADPATDLVELGKAQGVGAVDQDGVD